MSHRQIAYPRGAWCGRPVMLDNRELRASCGSAGSDVWEVIRHPTVSEHGYHSYDRVDVHHKKTGLVLKGVHLLCVRLAEGSTV